MKPLYTFVGGGNMGRALIGGLLRAGHPSSRIRVADAHGPSRDRCASEFGVETFDDNGEAAAGADAVVLAVKPQQMREAARGLAQAADGSALFVSIAAGITLGHLATWLGAQRAIVRCMPNTPALIGAGAAALCANARTSAAQRDLAGSLLESVGLAVWLEDEAQMDAVTALSGSGPAYVFLLLELLERAAGRLGLPAELARALAIETVAGAARLARESKDAPEALRHQVTSPGGTTERALAAFEAAGLAGIVEAALTAARDRSVELAKEFEA